MSREIKFRVWDKDGKLIGFNRFYQGRWSCQLLKKAGGSEEWSNGVLHGPQMDQFTGLKDGKRTPEFPEGQEIYERDIMGLYNSRGVVEWADWFGGWHVRWITKPTGHSSVYELVSRRQTGRPNDVPNHTVFGNIHENPDLLEPEVKQ